MSKEIYTQLVSLKSEEDNIKRGRDFEALIREIMPWDQRPPIVSSQDSEQLDGVFVYNGVTYIIESKAVKKNITPGMKEWEDFELKLRRREKKRVVGLFCCLFEVSKAVIERAKEMNLTGVQTIVIFGNCWEELLKSNIYFPSFLDYMMLLSNVKNSPTLDSIKRAQDYIYDKHSLETQMLSNAQKTSSSFLRRFKHKFHDSLYIERAINTQITSYIQALSPQSLKGIKNKDGAKQIIIIRDFSGSGKTTLSIDLVSHSKNAFCFAVTANLNTIDETIDRYIDLNKYPNAGLNELLAVNKPLMFIVDSLDETPLQDHVQKRREIKSLVKRVEELNLLAQRNSLSHFPILLMFTIREEYWRDWEASFEGRQEVVQLQKVLSNYNQTEFSSALEKYSAAYNFSIINQLSREAASILSIPINLEIFSEANHFEGDIKVEDIWEGKILSNFFDKKEEAISKHHIEGLNGSAFYRIISRLAYNLLEEKTTLFSKATFKSIVTDLSTHFDFSSDQILLNLISEQIIINDSGKVTNYRFKYIRFMEYLVALDIIENVAKTEDYTTIDHSIKVIYDSNILSIYSVLNNIKHICKTRYQDIEQEIINYYSHSDAYLKNYLPELRGQISRGESINSEVIKSIVTNNFIQSASTSWNTFFILAAKKINQKPLTIISAFKLAWETNKSDTQRWKLISKLGDRGLLFEENVIFCLFNDSTAKEWEVYLGQILFSGFSEKFMQLWTEIGGDRLFLPMVNKDPEEWHVANRILSLIYTNDGFILGDIYSNEKPQKKEYVVFEKASIRKLSILPPNEALVCDELVEGINQMFLGNPSRSFFSISSRPPKSSMDYLNIKLENLFTGKYGSEEKPFLNHLFHQFPATKSLLWTLKEHSGLQLPLNEADKNGRSLFQEILHIDSEETLWMFDFIFSNGYHYLADDEHYLSTLIKNNEGLSAKAFENACMALCFIKVEDKNNYSQVSAVQRELCVLFSAKYKRNIGFRFTNFLQVANNALEHYSGHTDLFIRAFSIYGRIPELEIKASYQKKVEALRKGYTTQNHDYDTLFKSVFIELF